MADISMDIQEEEEKYNGGNDNIQNIDKDRKEHADDEHFLIKNIDKELSKELSDIVNKKVPFKIEIAIFAVCILIAFVMSVLYVSSNSGDSVARFGMLLCVVLTTWIGVTTGILTIFNGLSIRKQAEEVMANNKVYAGELQKYQRQNIQFKDNVNDLKKANNALIDTESDLNETVNQFDGILKDLEALRDDWPELDNIFHRFSTVDALLKDMQQQKDLAHLYQVFHSKCKRDQSGLTKHEWNSFLDDISQADRDKLQKFEEFSKVDSITTDGIISMHEFETLIQKLFVN